MFDLIAKGHQRSPHGDTGPMMVSFGVHSMAAVILVVPLLYITDSIPQVPSMMAFVAAAPDPPPPPPPPPPAQRLSTPEPQRPEPPGAPTREFVAPVEAPTAINPEDPRKNSGSEFGVPGGVEGGVPDGVAGGVVAGTPPTPPPPPPPAPTAPVRIGGDVRQPALLSSVGPEYPQIAVRAQIQGVVVLEAVVDTEGHVEDVKVLRSIPLLNKAAIDAVRQWRYAPLLLNGHPARFILTVNVTFRLTRDS